MVIAGPEQRFWAPSLVVLHESAPICARPMPESKAEAVSAATDEERLIKIHDVIQQLPPPHYRSVLVYTDLCR
ncbi:hypothetical protein JZ751_002329 [Albula glossodonta]|uniref:Uncharacterized protein n=1 Tax=Albula glossodonta TaxID=121402 RepID=A0A8T2PBJ9_9TELE|nr:hypothetical protein JZ751_002329 [Albula glossodonta]